MIHFKIVKKNTEIYRSLFYPKYYSNVKTLDIPGNRSTG